MYSEVSHTNRLAERGLDENAGWTVQGAYLQPLGFGAHGACVQQGELVASIWRGGHPTLRRVTRPPGPPVRGAGVTLPPRTTHSSSTQGRGISFDKTQNKK